MLNTKPVTERGTTVRLDQIGFRIDTVSLENHGNMEKAIRLKERHIIDLFCFVLRKKVEIDTG